MSVVAWGPGSSFGPISAGRSKLRWSEPIAGTAKTQPVAVLVEQFVAPVLADYTVTLFGQATLTKMT